MVALLRHLGAGLALGVLTGAVARGFMRLLTDDPEFTWAGTGFIVGLFTVAGLSLAAAYDLKLRHRSQWWKLIALPSALLATGAGMLLIPGILGTALLMSGRRWLRVMGLVVLTAFLAAFQPLLGQSGEPFTARTAAGIMVMLGCCAAVAAGLRAALIGWSRDDRSGTPAGDAESDRRDGADRGRDRGSTEDPLDLHHRGVEQGLAVGLVRQGGNGGVVLVQTDRREQSQPDDHPDHPSDDDEGTRRAVGVVG